MATVICPVIIGSTQGPDPLTKHEHFRTLLGTARARGFAPTVVVFDSRYGSLDNLKLIRDFGWIWLTQLKVNRHIDPDRTGNRAVSEVDFPSGGQVVHLKGYGLIQVFRIVTQTVTWNTGPQTIYRCRI